MEAHCFLCSTKYIEGGNISFHRFPFRQNPRNQWITSIQNAGYPTVHLDMKMDSVICSKHFSPCCFLKNKNGLQYLKVNAVPTLFTFKKRQHKKEVHLSDGEVGENISLYSDEPAKCVVSNHCTSAFPKVTKLFKFPKDPYRRRLWEISIHGTTWKSDYLSRVCARHFKKGKPSNDEVDPDYVPSIFDVEKPISNIIKRRRGRPRKYPPTDDVSEALASDCDFETEKETMHLDCCNTNVIDKNEEKEKTESEGMTIVFNESESSDELVKRLQEQRRQRLFCDLCFHVNGQKFYAHRSVVASRSLYFAAIAKDKKIIPENLTIDCQEARTFAIFLEYLYSGEISINESTVSDLLNLAHTFLVSKLKDCCIQFLKQNLNELNCLDVDELAARCDLPELRELATDFFKTHTLEVLKQAQFLEFSANEFYQVIQKVATLVDPRGLLEYVCRWVQHDPKSRESRIHEMVSVIDWKQITKDKLNTSISILESNARHMLSGYCNSEECSETSQTDHIILDKEPVSVLYEEVIQTNANNDDIIDEEIILTADTVACSLENEVKNIVEGMCAEVVRDEEEELGNEEYSNDIGDHSYTSIRGNLSISHHRAVRRITAKLVECLICNFRCKFNKTFFYHMRTHFDGPPYQCKSCNFRCAMLADYVTHLFMH